MRPPSFLHLYLPSRLPFPSRHLPPVHPSNDHLHLPRRPPVHPTPSRWLALTIPTTKPHPSPSQSPTADNPHRATPQVFKILTQLPFNLHNTPARHKQPFTTLQPNKVKFYSCGPTIYDYAHIGNFRAFLSYDLLKRFLLYRGYEVMHVMNLTDVDDKIIKKCNELGCCAKELTDKYAKAFFEDIKQLNIIPADVFPRATQHIGEIEKVVLNLKEKGFAYEKDKSIYFSVKRFEGYGGLSGVERNFERDRVGATENDEYEKENVRDFALWKAHKEQDRDVVWNTKLGRGRPGWHIECTCMAIKYLGEGLDIHAGGKDLVFPHHENEIAQSEAYTGNKFSTFWMHNGFVNINEEKMSKSLGNFQTLRQLVQKPLDARAFRYLVITSHYRSDLNFSSHTMRSARKTIKRLDAFRSMLDDAGGAGGEEEMTSTVSSARQEFAKALSDDLNSPRAAAAVFQVVNTGERLAKKGRLGRQAADIASSALSDFDKVYGVFYTPPQEYYEHEGISSDFIPADILQLFNERNAARKEKAWQRADELRQKLQTVGYSVRDTPSGAVLEPIE